MSMNPQPIPEVPPETVRVVRAAFPKGNLSIWLRDSLGTIDQYELFADLYPERGQPACAPWRLALVTVFQFLEDLTDLYNTPDNGEYFRQRHLSQSFAGRCYS